MKCGELFPERKGAQLASASVGLLKGGGGGGCGTLTHLCLQRIAVSHAARSFVVWMSR
jgi:hypothetical protein